MRLTDWELLKHSPVPVLVVKNRRRYERPVLLAAVDPTHANAKPTQLDDEILTAAVAMKRVAWFSARHACLCADPDGCDASRAAERRRGGEARIRARAKARVRLDKSTRQGEARSRPSPPHRRSSRACHSAIGAQASG